MLTRKPTRRPAKDRAKPIQRERREQQWFVKWFKLQYPGILIAASANGGARDAKEASFMKAEGVLAGMPDLQIYRACRGYHGLFIEMKAAATKDSPKGRISTVQVSRINQLNAEGYYAIVCWGWVEAKEVADWYLNEDKEY